MEPGGEETRPDAVVERSGDGGAGSVDGEVRREERVELLSVAPGAGDGGPARGEVVLSGGEVAPPGEAGSGEGEGASEAAEAAPEGAVPSLVGGSSDAEGAPKSRVAVRMTGSKGQVEGEVIRRVLARVAQACHRRALRRDPAVSGRFGLKFTLNGDYKGPTSLLIDGSERYPKLASCLRRAMDRTRWPTGRLCGVGFYEASVDFRAVDAS